MQRILYLGNLLSKQGYSPTMVELLGPRLECMGYKLLYAGKSRLIVLRFLEIFFSLIFRSYDKVLIDTYSTRAFYFAFLGASVSQFRNKLYFPILHGGNLPNRLKNVKVANWIFGNAVMNIAVSGYLESAFINSGYKVVQIPNFLDIKNYSFKIDYQSLKTPSLLWVRSFDAIYNPILALDILELIHHYYPEAHLCMVGPDKDGTMDGFKDDVKKRKLNNHVRVMGRLSKKDWHVLSKDYNVFLNTTHVDNAPVSVTEAMALGLPVVSTKVGGISWMIEHEVNGLLYPDGDSFAASGAIIRLMTEPDLYQSITIAARKRVENLDWEIVKRQWKSLLG